MSPKDKASELVFRCAKILYDGMPVKRFKSKQLALLIVEEIIEENEANGVQDKIAYTVGTFLTNAQYWQSVKEEITKL